MIATIYIPPQHWRFFNDDEFDLFEQEIASVRSNFDYIYLLGDFNAQTATMPDYTVLDPFFPSFSILMQTRSNTWTTNVFW